jgi:hypothetical protein
MVIVNDNTLPENMSSHNGVFFGFFCKVPVAQSFRSVLMSKALDITRKWWWLLDYTTLMVTILITWQWWWLLDYTTMVVTTWLHDSGGDYLITWQWWWLLDYTIVGDYLITRQWWWLLDYMKAVETTWLHNSGGDYLITRQCWWLLVTITVV